MKFPKVILISIDGMRPDGLLSCGNSYVETMFAEGECSTDVATVFPSATLPCHMSMFHSVDPGRHGVTTNTYVPSVRPIEGLATRLKNAGKINAMFYGWEPLRDITRPGDLCISEFLDVDRTPACDRRLTDRALACIGEGIADFVFLYLPFTDSIGHRNGWMSPEYLQTISEAVDCVRRVREACGENSSILVTADHGGHDRIHGTDQPVDMTIPLLMFGKEFRPGTRFSGASILDVAPTVADLFGIAPAADWEGRSLLTR